MKPKQELPKEKSGVKRIRPHRNSGGNAKRMADQWNRVLRLHSKVVVGGYDG